MKRLLKIILPVVLLAGLFGLFYYLTIPKADLNTGNPEIDAALLTLQDYGYESSQITQSLNYGHLCIFFTGFVVTVAIYFYIYDWNEKKKILGVIEYVRKINQKIYDLKIDEEAEDELSLLADELYKTTILLQESAEIEKKRAKNMENALADISHQLRTPLTSLQIALDNLYDNPDLDTATRQDLLRSSGRQVKQMSELVVTLLNLARLDNGSLKMRPKTVPASLLIDEVVDRLSILAELSHVRINVSGNLDAKLNIDKKWAVEALSNIVKNCIEHSEEGQSVDIAIENNAIYTKITISDCGDGIPRTDLRHIFERFYKAKNARPDSVGIGLAFAKTLIEADNGQVRVKSRVGEGTEFVVTYYKH